MYLAHFRVEDASLVQGMVRFPNLPDLPADVRASWWDLCGQATGSALVAGAAGVGLRVLVSPGVSLERALFVCAPDVRAQTLRLALDAFGRLETIVPFSQSQPSARQEFDAVAENFPPLRVCVSNLPFFVGKAWLACDFRLSSSLHAYAAEAADFGYRLGYQVNVQPVAMDREPLRTARLNYLLVREVPGIPPALARMQERLVEHLNGATFVCSEYVGVDSEAALSWLKEALDRQFRHQYGSLRFAPPSWELGQLAFSEELACPAFDDSASTTVSDRCGSAIDDAECLALLNWRPTELLSRKFPRPAGPGVLEFFEPPVLAGQLPGPYQGRDPYLFVSYRHFDIEQVAPIIGHLGGWGWHVWYDRAIAGGTEWNALLEERLGSCKALVVFLSQSAVASKYVRREVQFADSIGKPIIAILMGNIRLEHGMALILGGLQMLRMGEEDFLARLQRAVAGATGGR